MSDLIHEGPKDPNKPPVPGEEKPTTERERTTVTEPRNPGTLRFEESEADNSPAPAEPSAEPSAPSADVSAPAQPSAATPTQHGATPEGATSIGNQPEDTNAPAPEIELPNLDSLLGGGR